MSKLKPEKDGEEGGVFVVMPDDDLTDATAADEPIVLVVTGENETATQVSFNIVVDETGAVKSIDAVSPFRRFIKVSGNEQSNDEDPVICSAKEFEESVASAVKKAVSKEGINLLSKDTKIFAHHGDFVWIGEPDHYASKEERIKALREEYEKETGGLEHLINGGINE